MWDEITVSIPETGDTQKIVEQIRKAVEKETEESAGVAEHEWKRGARGDGLSRFSAAPVVNLRPSGSGFEVLIRYVTRASERFGVRNRLYQDMIELMHKGNTEASADQAGGAGNREQP
jgi:hypothetical protein